MAERGSQFRGPIDTDLNAAAGDWAVPQKAATAPYFAETLEVSAHLMRQWCEQIWHSGEYHLFPVGMHNVRKEGLVWGLDSLIDR